MKLVAKIKLLPTDAQRGALLATMERFNEACNWLAGKAFAAKLANKFKLQKLHYRELRELFGLSSQMAVRVIGKVVDAYCRDLSIMPTFKARSSIPYDARILSFEKQARPDVPYSESNTQGVGRISILTLSGTRSGREVMGYVAAGEHADRVLGDRGEAKLILRKGRWYLHVVVEVEAKDPLAPTTYLGVDFGIVNLATDSDGERHTGASVEKVRVRILDLRGKLQKKGSRSARRHLKKLAGKEARFRTNTNHIVSKRLVRKAKDTGRGIALEDLQGIRDRVTVRRAQRARHGGWAFFQLRFFVAYKAKRVGVPVVAVDPRNTSRTCLLCGHCEGANRRSQSEFLCKSCGFAENADVVGAVNIARRAAVNRPIVSSVET